MQLGRPDHRANPLQVGLLVCPLAFGPHDPQEPGDGVLPLRQVKGQFGAFLGRFHRLALTPLAGAQWITQNQAGGVKHQVQSRQHGPVGHLRRALPLLQRLEKFFIPQKLAGRDVGIRAGKRPGRHRVTQQPLQAVAADIPGRQTVVTKNRPSDEPQREAGRLLGCLGPQQPHQIFPFIDLIHHVPGVTGQQIPLRVRVGKCRHRLAELAGHLQRLGLLCLGVAASHHVLQCFGGDARGDRQAGAVDLLVIHRQTLQMQVPGE